MVAALVAVAAAQAGKRGCSLQVTVDPFLWAEYRAREAEDGEGQARARFHVTSLVSRLVNAANTVLDDHYFDRNKYGLILQDIQVSQNIFSSILFNLLCLLWPPLLLSRFFKSLNVPPLGLTSVPWTSAWQDSWMASAMATTTTFVWRISSHTGECRGYGK